jgi:hypothetical protein
LKKHEAREPYINRSAKVWSQQPPDKRLKPKKQKSPYEHHACKNHHTELFHGFFDSHAVLKFERANRLGACLTTNFENSKWSLATQIRPRLYNLVGIKSHSRNINEHLVPTWSEKSGYSDRLLVELYELKLPVNHSVCKNCGSDGDAHR